MERKRQKKTTNLDKIETNILTLLESMIVSNALFCEFMATLRVVAWMSTIIE